ncbi:PPOX class F420-dependent oxidoreductase [Rubrobacter indicoceani]|uniref:PPOX class F420-dependent oxidoreductase n=1 Tax=Rubrobacter indicoceani TaxID=2051957 RepID=UPI0013C4D60B|nr:PPOX class F420-dependent oxidoreductase [Rubrobacter indicoceani]
MRTLDKRNTPGSSGGPGHFGALEGQRYASLSTFKRSGEAVVTPVWFAEAENRLYVMTIDGTGKVKRIRNNPSVTLAPCDFRGRLLGGAVGGRARMLSEERDERRADRALAGKYGFRYRAFGAARNVISRRAKRVFVEIASPDTPETLNG